jgi:hypothetical protein
MSRRDPELERLDAALRDRMEDLAVEILGLPNKRLSSRREMRWGRRGSVKLDLDGPNRGLYINYEDGSTGGGPLDLILNEMGFTKVADAINWAYGWLGWEKPRFNAMSVAERFNIEADIRNLLGDASATHQSRDVEVAAQPQTISGAAMAARNAAGVQPALPARGRFKGLLGGVEDAQVPETSAAPVQIPPAATLAAVSVTVDEPFESAPIFRKGLASLDADIARLTVLVMGGDTVFQHEGYAEAEFSAMVSEAMDRAVGFIARQIVADATVATGKVGA